MPTVFVCQRVLFPPTLKNLVPNPRDSHVTQVGIFVICKLDSRDWSRNGHDNPGKDNLESLLWIFNWNCHTCVLDLGALRTHACVGEGGYFFCLWSELCTHIAPEHTSTSQRQNENAHREKQR